MRSRIWLLIVCMVILLSTGYGGVNTSVTYSETPSDWIDVKSRGAVSGANSTAAIQSAIDEVSSSGGGTVYFPKGNYIVDQINVKSNVSLVGNHATLTLASTSNTALSLQAAKDVLIQGLKVDGGLSTTYTASSTAGTKVGILINQGERISVQNTIVQGFSLSGIQVTEIGYIPTHGNSFKISNSELINNYQGIVLGSRAEYVQVSQVTAVKNKVGIVVAGGNNHIVDSMFNDNVDGANLVVGPNHGHGSFTGSVFNHNSRYSLYTENITIGETFTNCHFFYGTIYIKNSKGIQISDSMFGSTAIHIEGGGYNSIKDNVIQASTTLTKTGSHYISGNYDQTTGALLQ